MDNISITQNPTCFFVLGIIWSFYQGVRGAIEQRLNQQANRKNNEKIAAWKNWENWIVLYIHDFAFRAICTFSGFVAIYFACLLYGDKSQIQNLTAGDSVFLVFLIIVSITGVGGQLHYLILMGKWPK